MNWLEWLLLSMLVVQRYEAWCAMRRLAAIEDQLAVTTRVAKAALQIGTWLVATGQAKQHQRDQPSRN